MTRLPSLSGLGVIRALERAEFTIVRVKGSHHFLKHSDGRSTVVPVRGQMSIGAETHVKDYLRSPLTPYSLRIKLYKLNPVNFNSLKPLRLPYQFTVPSSLYPNWYSRCVVRYFFRGENIDLQNSC